VGPAHAVTVGPLRVDTATQHGHKTRARGFDGYKGHVAVDPDSEVITDTEVIAGNVGDAAVAPDLIDDLLAGTTEGTGTSGTGGTGGTGGTAGAARAAGRPEADARP